MGGSVIPSLRTLAEVQLLKTSAGLLGSGQYILTETHTEENLGGHTFSNQKTSELLLLLYI